MSKWESSKLRMIHTADISTLLSKDTEIRGAVKTLASIRVDGTVIGDLSSSKTVTVGTTGIVEGNISAEEIIIAGRVKGTLSSRGKISLESTAQIEGDLNTTRLSIAEGAVFRGQSNMASGVRPPAVVTRPGEGKTDNAADAQRERVAAA
jgi:cytoskeletal protein CcmA (bactofilin family)